jgi:single-strand DNA-binding protein
MTDFNDWGATGRIARDPELRTTPAGQKVLNFVLANNKSYKPAGSEEWKSDALFMECEVWGAYADIQAPKLFKGYTVVLRGRLRQDSWDDKDGNKRTRMKCVVEFISILKGAKEAAAAGGQETPQAPMSDDIPF